MPTAFQSVPAVDLRRRQMLLAASGWGLGTALAPTSSAQVAGVDPWDMARDIARQFDEPLRFAARDFDIVRYGAKPCPIEQTLAWVSYEEQALIATPAARSPDSSAAINAAIAACHQAGGGRVVVPAGNWFCAGPLVLLSQVHLHLQSQAQIFFSTNPADYAKNGSYDCGPNGRLTLTRWEGNDCLNFSPLIYALNQDNIALTGEDWSSVLDGQGGVNFEGDTDCWWSWKGRSQSAFGQT